MDEMAALLEIGVSGSMAAAVLAAGRPSRILPHLQVHPDRRGLRPPFVVLQLPDRWHARSDPNIDEVRSLLDAGVGMSLPSEANDAFDLAVFEGHLSSVPLLWISLPVRNAQLLRDMSSLQNLRSPRMDAPVDLSHLLELRSVAIDGPELQSALASPNLQSALVDAAVFDRNIAVSSSVRDIAIDAREIDLAHLCASAPDLSSIILFNVNTLDLTPLAELKGLQEFKIINCRAVIGMAALASLTSLKRVSLDRIRQVDDAWSVLDVRSKQLEVMGCPDFSVEFRDAARVARPGWYIAPAKRKAPQLVKVTRVDRGQYVVTFDEWGWLQDQLTDDLKDHVIGSEALEQILSAETASAEATREVSYEFDSEGDTVIATAPSRSDAMKLQKVWTAYLRDIHRMSQALSAL